MRSLFKWLRKHLWAAFLLHQLLLLTLVLAVLWSVRSLTGRSIHLGRDSIGLADGIAVALLSIAVIFLTAWYYRLLKGADAPGLGIRLSVRRFFDLVAGLIVGFLFFSTPLWISLWRGTAQVTDTIGSHFDTSAMIAVLSSALVLLLLQSAMEETTSRAFPMRLWEHWSLLLRLFIPAIFFVLVHLISETFDAERAAILLIAGIVQGLAYALTGNIWLPTGLHWGANVAVGSMSGMWHMGAIVNVAGPPAMPLWAMGLILVVLLSVVYLIKRHLEAARVTSRSANA